MFKYFIIILLVSLGFIGCQKGESASTTSDKDTSAIRSDLHMRGSEASVASDTAKVANASGEAENANAAEDENLPTTSMKFEKETHDFGKIKEGEQVTYEFKFENTGKNPLKIKQVKPSCGCTASDYSKEPIAPGGKGYVKVTFDSKGKKGQQTKNVTVTANTEPAHKKLFFNGEVVESK